MASAQNPDDQKSSDEQRPDQDSTRIAHGEPHPGSLQLRPGQIVDNDYRVIKLLGSGGAGQVYEVEQIKLGRNAALKILNTTQMDESAWRRFQYEAQLIGKLNQSSIVQVYNFGIHDRYQPYYVMELVSGDTLAESIQKHGPIGAAETVDLFIDVAQALDYAHNKGIIHRDVKPGNILLVRGEGSRGYRAKLLDFGIAKLKGNQSQGTQALTMAGEVVGSPLYMSPEQCTGQGVDERSDIYSLGCTIFETLTGETPFRGKTVTDTVMMHFNATPPKLSQFLEGEPLPSRLEGLVQKCLAKKQDDRYQTMSAVLSDLSLIKDELRRGSARGADGSEPGISIRAGGAEAQKLIEQTGRWKKPVLITVALMTLAAGGSAYLLTESKKHEEKHLLPNSIDSQLSIVDVKPAKVKPIATGAYLVAQELEGKGVKRHYQFNKNGPNPGFFRVTDFRKVPFVTTDKSIQDYKFDATFGLERCEFFPDARFLTTPALFDGFDRTFPDAINFNSRSNIAMDFSAPECLKHLAQDVCLTGIGLESTTFGDKDLSCLNKFPNLLSLDFGGCQFTPSILAQQKFWKNLREVTITNIQEDLQPVLERIKKENKLVKLDLSRVTLTDQNVQTIADTSFIKDLNFNGTAVTDKQLMLLTKLRLKSLYLLHDEAMTSKALPALSKQKQLVWLVLPGCRDWTPEQCAQLKRALPKTKIDGLRPDLVPSKIEQDVQTLSDVIKEEAKNEKYPR